MPRAKKRLGQHFLSDPAILTRIADALAPAPGETVLEIGPGLGGLTRVLAGRSGRLIAIEKDRDLVPSLRTRFPAVQVVEGDALEVDWHRLVESGGDTRAPRFLVIGNIPYNITSPLIDKALLPPRPRCMVFLVQKEVAVRVAAAPGGKEYGALTVGVQAVARVERLFTVKSGAFSPPPKVDSAVLRLTPLEHPLIEDDEIRGFRKMVVGLFGFRRKQMIRGLRELTGWSPETAALALDRSEIEPRVRPEGIAPARFVRLYRVLREITSSSPG